MRPARRRARRGRGRDRGRVGGHAPRRKIAYGGGDDAGPPCVVERCRTVRVPRLVFERGGRSVRGDLPRARRLEIPVARLVVRPEVVGVPLRGGEGEVVGRGGWKGYITVLEYKYVEQVRVHM